MSYNIRKNPVLNDHTNVIGLLVKDDKVLAEVKKILKIFKCKPSFSEIKIDGKEYYVISESYAASDEGIFLDGYNEDEFYEKGNKYNKHTESYKIEVHNDMYGEIFSLSFGNLNIKGIIPIVKYYVVPCIDVDGEIVESIDLKDSGLIITDQV